jgi:hypothetical protein
MPHTQALLDSIVAGRRDEVDVEFATSSRRASPGFEL